MDGSGLYWCQATEMRDSETATEDGMSRQATYRAKLAALAIGGIATVSLGALSVSMGDNPSGFVVLAGSGNAPANTTYTRPSVGAASMGATATETTPGSMPATTKAVPPLKAP